MKHTKLVALLLLAAAALSVIGTASAYMVKSTQQVTNLFELANVDCEVVETFANNEKSNVTIKNTSDIPAYIRVRVVTYWEDSKGNPALTPQSKTCNLNAITTLGEGWIESPAPAKDAKCRTFYYTLPVNPQESTGSDLLGGKKIVLDSYSKVDDGITYTYHQVVDILAEAVQAMPYEDIGGGEVVAFAPYEAWGVKFVKPTT